MITTEEELDGWEPAVASAAGAEWTEDRDEAYRCKDPRRCAYTAEDHFHCRCGEAVFGSRRPNGRLCDACEAEEAGTRLRQLLDPHEFIERYREILRQIFANERRDPTWQYSSRTS